ncbi:nucleotidyltransferase domain-containing protein [Rhizobium leguminosarum]|uniref:nucleotidyltransferase domain-containing protein n=1 Tax=Rhizobium leguminosarum TaxID=384 RepID=UPI00143FAEB6|nr:nucleotidyltransferase [Rhizobium leguminosarum]NKL21811.1 nucleotidyltransferase [Rhizobium leguminosarum bv. viciae]
MAISESQLETWSQIGKAAQFTDAYNSIRENLLNSSAPYPVSLVDVHLQGSYGNDTNVWGDSDVDIVLCHNGAFYYDLNNMAAPEQFILKSSFSGEAVYRYENFKGDAQRYISGLYRDVDLSGKAIYIPGNSGRRSADVLVCQQFRRYYSLHDYRLGIAFMRNGARIENFPKQHSENCTTKHQATNQNFKRMVRIFKNMRNSMIAKGILADKVAPSYFIEGMLYNVPNEKFVGSYEDMWIKCFNWIVTADALKLTTASGLHWLVRDELPVCWPHANFRAFTRALKHHWENT